MARVFVSSTWEDLRPEREAVEQALRRMQVEHRGMEYFGSRPGTPREESLAEVDRAQLFVLILGGRCGSGITEEEYNRACLRGLDCLVYLKDEDELSDAQRDPDPDRREQARTFRDLVKTNHTVGPAFRNPDRLATDVVADVARYLLDPQRGAGRQATELPPPPHHLQLLANRKPQAELLDDALHERLSTRAGRARVYLLFGRAEEDHDAFVERFNDCLLRRALDLKGRDDAVNSYKRMQWPDTSRGEDAAYLRLYRQLGQELRVAGSVDTTEFANAIARAIESLDAHLTLRYEVFESRWNRSDAELMHRWVEFWQTLPAGSHDKLVTVFLCLKCGGVTPRGGFWLRLLPGRAGGMRQCYERFAVPPGAAAEKLPVLNPVSADDAREWAETVCPTWYQHLDTDTLLSKAKSLFGQRDAMHYEELKPGLKEAVRAAHAKYLAQAR